MANKYYEGSGEIIALATEVGRLTGIIDANHLQKPETRLRRENRIRTIYSSLAIEGNTLSEDQISTLLSGKRVVAPAKDILEVRNAFEVYQQLSNFDALREQSFLSAHGILMKGLIERPGEWRTKSVGIFKGTQVTHMAPPAWNVHNLMGELFTYLREHPDPIVIKSCVFHYEMEFIHPFMDGNGRMGRLWQTVLLMKYSPVYEFLPVEGQIKQSQQEYYEVLAAADREGMSTKFVEYMLRKIVASLTDLIASQRRNLSNTDRIEHFIEYSGIKTFTRKEYLTMFRRISTATATRDLAKGVELGVFKRVGSDRTSRYVVV